MRGRIFLRVMAGAGLLAMTLPAAAGVTSADVTVKKFRSNCQSVTEWCRGEVGVALSDRDMFGSLCAPTLPPDSYTTRVVDWLRAHPEWDAKAADAGISAAIDALWSCPAQ